MILRRTIPCFILLLFLAAPVVYAQKPNKKNKNTPTQPTGPNARLANLFGDAVTQKLLGNYKEAMSLFMMCLKEEPGHAASCYEIASLFMLSKQYEAALEYIETAVKREPGNKWYLQLQSQVLVELKKYKEATRVYQALIKAEPDNYDYMLDLADVYIVQKKYKEAIAIYDQLETKVGITPEVSLQKQKLYEALGKFPLAVKEIEKLIQAFPTEAEYYGMLAELYLAHGKKDEARQLYEKVLAMDPQNPVIHLALANYYQEAGDADKSYTYLKMAFGNPGVDLDDKVKILLSYYDISANNATRRKEAFELIDILIATHPAEPKCYSIQGDFLLREGKYAESRDAFEKVLEYDNSKYPVWEQLMALYLQLGQYDRLTQRSAEAMELFPTQPYMYYYNGYGHYMQKEYQQAADAFAAGKDLVVDNNNLLLQFYSGMGDCYHYLKRYSESDDAFENALAISQANTIVLNNYAYYLSVRRTNLERARELSMKANRLEPHNPTYLDTYAWVLYQLGEYAAARIQIEEAIRYGGSSSGEILEHYGDILFKLGENEKAVEEWQKAKNLGGELSSTIDAKIRDKKLP